MKKMYNKLLFIPTICSVLLFPNFCADVEGPIEINAVEELPVSNVKEAVNKLINSKNYTVEISTKTGPIDVTYNMYYTENGFYDDYLGDEYGYVNVKEGVFYFNLYNREFTASQLLKDENGSIITSLWDSNTIYGFNRLRTQEFENATAQTYSATQKRVKNFFMNMLHVDPGKYHMINPVEFKVTDTLEFSFSLTNGEFFNGKVTDFGTTKIDVIDEYLGLDLTYHTNDEKLEKIIRLFDNYNYTRLIYSDDVEDYSVVAGRELYHEEYFYTFFEDEFIASGLGMEIGMVGIDKTYGPIDANGKTYGPYEFKGSYYCFVTIDENGNESLQVMTSMPINTDPFIPNVYVYPTFLEMFSNSQYLQPTGGSENQFYTSKVSCVVDFVNNFQMGDTLISLGALPVGVYVEYLPEGSEEYAGTQGKETVVFELEVNYYGALTTIPYVYTDFNTTKVDCITQENVDKIIMDAIQSVIDKDAGGSNNEE